MTKIIHLKFAVNSHYDYSGMSIPKGMDTSELLGILGAKELIDCDHCTGRPKFNEKYRKSGKLEDRGTYEIHTDNPLDETLRLINEYKQIHHSN
jgi:hypothetical protein